MKKLLFSVIFSAIACYGQATLIAFVQSPSNTNLANLTPKPSFNTTINVISAPVTTEVNYQFAWKLTDGTGGMTIINIKPNFFAADPTLWRQVTSIAVGKDVEIESITVNQVTPGAPVPIAISK
jgi:hypothetical protein